MPVILSPNDCVTWLGTDKQDSGELEFIYEPFPTADMASYLVDIRVNTARNERAELVKPIDGEEAQAELPFNDQANARNSD
jgi:putative SOS response-associated peptidase YedK